MLNLIIKDILFQKKPYSLPWAAVFLVLPFKPWRVTPVAATTAVVYLLISIPFAYETRINPISCTAFLFPERNSLVKYLSMLCIGLMLYWPIWLPPPPGISHKDSYKGGIS